MQFHSSLFYFTFAQSVLCILLAVVLVIHRKEHRGAVLLSTILVLVTIREYLTNWIISDKNTVVHFAHYSGSFITFIVIPLLYYYFASFVNADFVLRSKKNILLFAYSMGVYAVFVLTHLLFVDVTSGGFIYSSTCAALLVQIPAVKMIWEEFYVFDAKVKENFSDDSKLRIKWLQLISAIIVILLGFRVLDVMTGPNLELWKISPLFIFTALFAFSFFCMIHSKLFFSMSSEIAKSTPPKTLRPFTAAEKEKYEARLKEYLSKQNPYLKTDFSLRELSEAIDLKPYRSSELLRLSYGKNFYNLVNELRVEHAKKLIIDPRYSHLNLLGIASECGFNSKSVFNSAFKKLTNKTPSEYRASILSH
jgi:AraC-like DNA-binding protein